MYCEILTHSHILLQTEIRSKCVKYSEKITFFRIEELNKAHLNFSYQTQNNLHVDF